ncbi:MAG: hypothetical protein J5814_08050 [Bacteroidaceae bacterium]|nr:hypothetical protein [Bacteroidaceae bacterium]
MFFSSSAEDQSSGGSAIVIIITTVLPLRLLGMEAITIIVPPIRIPHPLNIIIVITTTRLSPRKKENPSLTKRLLPLPR